MKYFIILFQQISYESKVNSLSIEKVNLEKKATNLLSQVNKITSDNSIKDAMISVLIPNKIETKK